MSDFGLKALAILVALTLSLSVNSESYTGEISFTVPVEIRNVPDSKLIVRPEPEARRVQVSVRGPSFLISRVAAESRVVGVTVPEGVGDHFTASVSAADLGFPSFVKILRIDPPQLNIELDKRIIKKIPLLTPRIGKLNDSLRLVNLETVPSFVEVRGSERQLARISVIETEVLDLRALTQSSSVRVAVRIPRSVEQVTPTEGIARVEIEVVQAEKTFAAVPIEARWLGNQVLGYRLDIEAARVTVSGPKDSLDKFVVSSIVPFVRLNQLRIESGTPLALEADLPDGLSLVRIEPATVRVVVSSTKRLGSAR